VNLRSKKTAAYFAGLTYFSCILPGTVIKKQQKSDLPQRKEAVSLLFFLL